jgi:hypothetical protein
MIILLLCGAVNMFGLLRAWINIGLGLSRFQLFSFQISGIAGQVNSGSECDFHEEDYLLGCDAM